MGDRVVVADADGALGGLDVDAALGDMHDPLLELVGLVTGLVQCRGHPGRHPLLNGLQITGDIHVLEERGLPVGAQLAHGGAGALGQRRAMSRSGQPPGRPQAADQRAEGVSDGAGVRARAHTVLPKW